MSRLSLEQQRLYLGADGADAQAPTAGLVDAQGRVRALVLELSRPAEWEPVSRLWQAVQADLGLPAPAIAVSGSDGYQLWFSLAQPLTVAAARTFLESLRQRYLAEIAPRRITLWPKGDDAGGPATHAAMVPARRAGNGPWSAFVAPDLAPMFAEEPWLDLPPNPDGQANLLSSLVPIAAADLQRALEQLQPVVVAPPEAATVEAPAAAAALRAAPPGGWTDPRRFLLDVMNDAAAPLALRIEAAKALLARPEGPAGA